MTNASAQFVGSVRVNGDQATVAVCGDLDVDKVSLFTDLMAQAVAFHARSVTVDVAGVTFLDTQVLQVIVRAAEQIRLTGAKVNVQGASPLVHRIFELTDLLGVLDVAQPVVPLAPSLAATVAALGTFTRTREVLDTALHMIVGRAQAVVVGADGASITLPRNGKLGTVAASNDTVLEMDHDQYDSGEGPCLDAATQGHRFNIDTLSAETRWPTFVPRAQARGINSILSTPLTMDGAPLGALNIYSRTAGAFTAQDNERADVFADECSVLLAAAQEDPGSQGLQAQVNNALLSREVIALAQGVVMHRDGISPEAAHTKLRDLSRRTSTPMRALSEQLVALHRDPSPTSPAYSESQGAQHDPAHIWNLGPIQPSRATSDLTVASKHVKAEAPSDQVLSDASLMGRIAAGDRASLELLYLRYAATCLGLSRRIVVDSHFAEDAVQFAFLSVWEHADRYRPEVGTVRSWLLHLTHHKAVDVVRTQEPHRSRQTPEKWLSEAIDTGGTPQQQAETTLESRRAINAIAQLSQQDREALMLCYYGGYTQTEVATRLGLPLGTVKTRCRHALLRLRTVLAPDPNELVE